MQHSISNFDVIATTPTRKDVLEIMEAGYRAIDTTEVVKRSVGLHEGVLSIRDKNFILADYERIFVIGFGKASCKAVQSIEDVLGDELDGGIVIDKHVSVCRVVNVYQGSHPLPSSHNVEVSQKIADLAENLTEKDLAIVVVSGGGSALLCLPMSECDQGNDLYTKFLHAGGTIEELNTIRKHISNIKGGGLAKLLYPATVASLVFCDVPGDHFSEVASGPTYMDETTIDDAKRLLEKYAIQDTFIFNETPKDGVYFEKVTNIPFVSNREALVAMKEKGEELGYEVTLLGDEVYDSPDVFLAKAESLLNSRSVVIAGGELSIALTDEGGIGGRNLYIAGQALSVLSDTDTLVTFASDGIDNKSPAAGAIVDVETKKKLVEKNIDGVAYHKEDKDSELFIEVGDAIITGDTGSNVSDLYLVARA
jgi:glycerate 2-kinase